ncbi:MAG: hypothetical protein AAGK21_13465 [Bacteroidota bacterium]
MAEFDFSRVVFYVDEDLDSDQFVLPVLEAGFRLVRHRDVLKPGAPDEEWIPYVADKGWFAFSHNREIQYFTPQREIVERVELGLFIVRGQSGQEGHHLFAQKVIGAQRGIGRFIHKNYRWFIAAIVGPRSSGSEYVCEPRYPKDREWGKGKMMARRQMAHLVDPPGKV